MCKTYTSVYYILFQCVVRVWREDLMCIDVQSREVSVHNSRVIYDTVENEVYICVT